MDFAVDEPTSPARPAAIRTAAVAFEASPGAPSAAAGPRPTDAQPSSPSSPLSDDALANAPLSVDAPPAAEPPRWSPAAPHAPSPPPRRGRAFGSPIHTQLGGVFYLVNLALYLQLYGDGENLPLPLWDFVGSMARALLGEPFTTGAFANDPVWTLLAELAGRSADEPPGAGFAPPAEWRLPRAWLIPFTPGPVRHWIADGRLSIWHAEGFAIVDVSIDGDLGAQLVAELAAYAGAIGPALDVRPPSSPHAAPSDGAVAWVARLVPYVRARLRRALGIEDDEIVARLLVHTARVHATATHVDVVLPLDALPIEVRFAGLDRDPGWVPAAGRFIAFHFE
jgi:hypothetical protein